MEYSIVVVDVTRNQPDIVFNDNKVGYPTTYGWGVRELQWVSPTAVIFPCEMSGWLHVCSVTVSGNLTDLIGAPNACEVQDYIVYDRYTGKLSSDYFVQLPF